MFMCASTASAGTSSADYDIAQAISGALTARPCVGGLVTVLTKGAYLHTNSDTSDNVQQLLYASVGSALSCTRPV